jgi:hypothetical protein
MNAFRVVGRDYQSAVMACAFLRLCESGHQGITRAVCAPRIIASAKLRLRRTEPPVATELTVVVFRSGPMGSVGR